MSAPNIPAVSWICRHSRSIDAITHKMKVSKMIEKEIHVKREFQELCGERSQLENKARGKEHNATLKNDTTVR
jgi:hypothetical protein